MKRFQIIAAAVVLIVAACIGAEVLSAQSPSSFSYTKYSWKSQTSTVSQTLFTPTVDSDYIVSLYADKTGAVGSVGLNVSWTDDYGSQSNGCNTSCVIAVHATAGNAVSVTITPPGGATFNAYVSVIGN